MQTEKLRTKLITLLKAALLLGVVLFCITPFLPDGKFDILKDRELLRISGIPFSLLPLVFLFTLANFTLEAFKWKLAAGYVQPISFVTALKGVLSGSAVSSIFPWRTGEFIGKVAYLEAENRVKGSYLSVYSSMTQFLMTVVLGLAGFMLSGDVFFQADGEASFWLQNLPAVASLFFLGLVLFLFLFRNKVMQWLYSLASPRLRYYFRGVKTIPLSLTLRLIALSLLRYVFFVLPYVVLLKVAEPSLDSFLITKGVAVVFLIQSLVPGFILSDLPVKGMIHIAVFMPLVGVTWAVGNAVLVVFVFNQMLPAVAGLFLLLFDKRNFLKK